MKTFRIHFTIKDYEDSFVIEGDTVEDCRKKVKEWFESRGTTYRDCDAWSEEIEN